MQEKSEKSDEKSVFLEGLSQKCPKMNPKLRAITRISKQRKCRLAIGVNAKKTGIPESQDNGIPTEKN